MTNIPHRIQRKRTKGWRMPPNTVNVSRPTKWGNPFLINSVFHRTGEILDAAGAVERYAEALILGRLAISESTVRRELRGKNLACWCALDQPCHADILLEVANEPCDQ